MKNKLKVIGAVIAFLIILSLGFEVGKKYIPSRERLTYSQYLNLNDENQYKVALNGEYRDSKAIKYDGEIYVGIKFVKSNLNDRFYFNDKDGYVLYTLPDQTVDIQVLSIDDKNYISLNDVLKYTKVSAFTGENPNVVSFNTMDSFDTATVKKKTAVRAKGGIKSAIVDDIDKNTVVKIVEKMDSWSKVEDEKGIIGYIKNSAYSKETAVENTFPDFQPQEYSHILRDHKICMGWNLITNPVANNNLGNIIASHKNLNVISPSWYSVKNNNGDLRDFSSRDYVRKAHDNNIEVWAMIENLSFNEARNKVYLKDIRARKNIINTLVDSVVRCGADGINLDFESISREAGEDYIQFIRELSVECRKNNLVLSVDNYVPKKFNHFYNRAEQAVFADYLVIMGYDEHFSSSKKAGSVASYGFVENGIDETLKFAPADQIINGVPGYTRLWTYTSDGLKAKSLSMYQAQKVINDYKLKPVWNDTVKQDYYEFENSKKERCEMWMENGKSMKEKINLIKEKNIAGVSLWRLGQESERAWTEISKIID